MPDARQLVYEQAHRRSLRERPEYLSALVRRRAVMDVLHEAAYADAAFHGVEVVTVGQAALERAWGKLPACDKTLCTGAGAGPVLQRPAEPWEVGDLNHHDDCPRGKAIRSLRVTDV